MLPHATILQPVDSFILSQQKSFVMRLRNLFLPIIVLGFFITSCDKSKQDIEPTANTPEDQEYYIVPNEPALVSVSEISALKGGTQFSIKQNGSLGTVAFNNSGYLEYTPDATTVEGDDIVKISALGKEPVDISFRITSNQNLPCRLMVQADRSCVKPDSSVSISVLNNDRLCGVDSITWSIVANPINGTSSFSGRNIIYTPNPSSRGRDFLIYQVCGKTKEGRKVCRQAMVSITIGDCGNTGGGGGNPIDSCRLVANNDSIRFCATPGAVGTIVINILANDRLCTGPLPIVTLTNPSHGKVEVIGNSASSAFPLIRYTRTPGDTSRVDRFTYTVCRNNKCATASVVLFCPGITPPPPPPACTVVLNPDQLDVCKSFPGPDGRFIVDVLGNDRICNDWSTFKIDGPAKAFAEWIQVNGRWVIAVKANVISLGGPLPIVLEYGVCKGTECKWGRLTIGCSTPPPPPGCTLKAEADSRTFMLAALTPGTAKNLEVIANDKLCGNPITLRIVSAPTWGTAAISITAAGPSIMFVPGPFSNTDIQKVSEFKYEITDTVTGSKSEANVRVVVKK
jgi:hypothetical protein